MKHPIEQDEIGLNHKYPFVSSEVEKRHADRFSTSLETNGTMQNHQTLKHKGHLGQHRLSYWIFF